MALGKRTEPAGVLAGRDDVHGRGEDYISLSQGHGLVHLRRSRPLGSEWVVMTNHLHHHHTPGVPLASQCGLAGAEHSALFICGEAALYVPAAVHSVVVDLAHRTRVNDLTQLIGL